MDLQRAREINRMCVQFVMVNEGVCDEPPAWLDGLTLRDLIDARDLVQADPGEEQPDGTRVMTLFCDDRFLAALYVAKHYPPAGNDIAILAVVGRAATVVIDRKLAES
jgi:hypothetical protein